MLRSDLPERPKPGVLLYCADCQSECSATRADYFMLDPDEKMDPCGECGGSLGLREKIVALVFVSTADAEETV
ncbi:hypothetical protein LCGC14_0609980 [marine sediment metagenome]|uniref:Uncharacterized protein n=1 Tax=marine sediment metagenome TaxID=412755 RepID=A0A0F9RS82_9ZZZZ